VKRFRKTRGGRGAFSLVEVMVAAALLVVGFLGIFSTFHSCAALRESACETNRAMFELQAVVEYIFSRPFDEVTTILPDGAPATVPGLTDGSPHAGMELADKEIILTYEDPAADPLQFTVTITWTSRCGGPRSETLSCARAR